VIVRWSLDDLPGVLSELGLGRPLLVASDRWTSLDIPRVGQWSEVPSHRIEVMPAADSLLVVGGGSAIDTAKAASAATGLPLVSVPTTYSGAEWTDGFGIRQPDRRIVGRGKGANLAGIVYEVSLTLDLPLVDTAGTAMNALAHCAEALYVQGRSDAGDIKALEGAELIARSLPEVMAAPHDVGARTRLLRGASFAGEALAIAGLGLAHAMAQTLGGIYGLPHGAMNALTLPPALRFNTALAPPAVARFGRAIGSDNDPAATVEALARLGGFERLRDYGVRESDLPGIAVSITQRPGNEMNPRPATPVEIEDLLRSIY
jgi:maleylacetate reductase